MDAEVAARGPDWPPEDIRRIIDALADGILISDRHARILYVNPAAEELLGRQLADLVGKSVAVLLSPRYTEWLPHFERAVSGDAPELIGTRVDVDLLSGDGTEVRIELVMSVGVSRSGEVVLIGVLRAGDRLQLQRLTLLTEQLLDVLNASLSEAPVEKLLESLCSRLGWEVGALWGLEPDGSLVCRGVWTTPDDPATAYVEEKRRNPTHDVGGLAELVLKREHPVWFTDIRLHERFRTKEIISDGLVSGCGFPIRYQGQCLGAVKMMSRTLRQPDPELIDLVGSTSGAIGEILHALEQAAEREALVKELETTKARLQFLLRANRIMSEASGYAETLDRLAEIAVPALGDLCLIDVVEEDGKIQRLASRHADPAKQALADELKAEFAPDPHGLHPSAEVMLTGRSRWSRDMSDEFLRATSKNDRHLEILKELSFTSYMTVPLMVEGNVRGTVTLVSAGSGRRYSERELAGAEELAAQIAGVVERARVFDWERSISHTLQRGLLPDRLPSVPGLSVSARYLPAGEDVEVGGDWYDVVRVGHGAAGLMVGDVQGHDITAASVMGQLRHGLALLLAEGVRPGDALGRINAFLIASGVSHIATVLVARLDIGTGELRLASAGHPAPVVVGSEKAWRPDVRPGPPLGIRGAVFPESPLSLEDEALLLFTDGLVERRGRHPDEGFETLLRAAEEVHRPDVEALVKGVLSRLLPERARSDDVAILAARRSPEASGPAR